jgi:glycosyltransferase involved in cell wall biosynthesis
MSKHQLPLVSIGIPTYNRADVFLHQALESAVNQTYPNIEIVVSDNCSTDRTQELVDSFKSMRIKYHKQIENIGAKKNYNYCLEQATGEYFLLLHDDDMIDPDFVEICLKALTNQQFEVGVVITGTRLIDSAGKLIKETTNRLNNCSAKEFFLGWFSDKVALYLCSTLYDTKKLKQIGGFRSETNLFSDVVATARLAALYGQINLHDVKASFRRHTGNMGGNPTLVDAWTKDSLFLLSVMCDHMPTDEEKKLVMKNGKRYLIKKNYRLCSSIRSPLKRLLSYYRVYRQFEFTFSPFHFWYQKYMFKYYNALVKKAKEVW